MKDSTSQVIARKGFTVLQFTHNGASLTFLFSKLSEEDDEVIGFENGENNGSARVKTESLRRIIANAVKSVVIDKTVPIYLMNTPTGNLFPLDEEDLRVFDLVLNEPIEETMFERLNEIKDGKKYET